MGETILEIFSALYFTPDSIFYSELEQGSSTSTNCGIDLVEPVCMITVNSPLSNTFVAKTGDY